MTSTARMELRAVVGRVLGWAALLPLMCCGCVSLGGKTPGPNEPPPATETPCQLVAIWQPNVRFAPDPMNGGVNNAGLAGRVHLFGQEMRFPMIVDGNLVVDLYEETDGGPSIHREEWIFNKDQLKQLAHRDMMGWGYSVFLPWTTYRPEISRVRMKVRFEPTKGLPLYTENTTMTLNNAGAVSPEMADAMFKKSHAAPPAPLPQPTPLPGATLPQPTPAPGAMLPANPVPAPMPGAAAMLQTQGVRPS